MRLIDADKIQYYDDEQGFEIAYKVDIDALPTLTPPNEWVSVEDRLPTKSGEYFAYTTDENINIIEFDEDYGEFGFRKEYYQDGAYLDSEWVKADWITHWMPLPTPPDSRPPEVRT